MVEKTLIKGNPIYIHVSHDSLNQLRILLQSNYKKKGYGWLISSEPTIEDREYGIKRSIYQLANAIPTYIEDNKLLECVGEYDNYLQTIKLYDENLEAHLEKYLKALK